ncbi:MAG: hypothetical protein ACYYK0_02025 [Candidatus Eutrophobiaceae bacterium]
MESCSMPFCPDLPTFAINRDIAAQRCFYLRFVRLFELDNSSPRCCVILSLSAPTRRRRRHLPRRRVTVTGRLMKIYRVRAGSGSRWRADYHPH